MMGLTLAERRAVTETTAVRYVLASKRGKSRILDELCANTGWHRNHARKALKSVLAPKVVTPRSPRPVKYGDDVIAALTVCWTVLGMPAGKRLAPMLGELVAVLRHFGELTIDEDTAELLASMSAATIDRRLAGERAKHHLRGRVGTKPGSLLKSQIPVRTWAEWDDARPGFVEIDLVWHDGGNRGWRSRVHADGHRYRDRLDREPLRTGQDRQMCVGRTQRHRPGDAVPDSGRGLRQRIRIHQRRRVQMVPKAQDHFHPSTTGQ
jgi:hypothetical protein